MHTQNEKRLPPQPLKHRPGSSSAPSNNSFKLRQAVAVSRGSLRASSEIHLQRTIRFWRKPTLRAALPVQGLALVEELSQRTPLPKVLPVKGLVVGGR